MRPVYRPRLGCVNFHRHLFRPSALLELSNFSKFAWLSAPLWDKKSSRQNSQHQISLGIFLFLPLFILMTGCSPLTSSAHDEKHQLELTLHEVQTNLDDLRHDINCFQTELQILDGRSKYYENALTVFKQQDLEKQQTKLEELAQEIQSLEKRWSTAEKNRFVESQELLQLTSHAKVTTTSLLQFKERIEDLEKELAMGQRRFEELGKLKTNIEALGKSIRKNDSAKVYKVRPGDSLEKIAKTNQTTVEKIKKLNGLEQDLIVVGQELRLPE